MVICGSYMFEFSKDMKKNNDKRRIPTYLQISSNTNYQKTENQC